MNEKGSRLVPEFGGHNLQTGSSHQAAAGAEGCTYGWSGLVDQAAVHMHLVNYMNG